MAACTCNGSRFRRLRASGHRDRAPRSGRSRPAVLDSLLTSGFATPTWLRRRVPWLLLLACSSLHAEPVRSLTILHLNDLHARLLPDDRGRGGFAHVAEVIRRERAKSDAVLVMHGGDLVQGSPVSTIFEGVPVYEVASKLGLDFHTLGNHEFDYGWRKIPEFIREASFPVVSANVVNREGELLAEEAYRIREVNGIRVAVIGVLTGELNRLTRASLRGPWNTLPVTETVTRYVDEIGSRADLIVVLSHIFPDEEDRILRENPRVPVIISGHHHGGQDEVKEYQGRICVKTRPYGRELGRLDIEFDLDRKRVVSHRWMRIPVNARTYPPDPATLVLVEKWEARVAKVVDVPIGESARTFHRHELQPWIESVMRDAVGADLAYMNLGGIRDGLPRGRILARHIWNVMPFDNLIVTARLNGDRLPNELRTGGGIDPEREYMVATNDFIAEKWRERGVEFGRDGPALRDALINWVRKHKVVR